MFDVRPVYTKFRTRPKKNSISIDDIAQALKAPRPTKPSTSKASRKKPSATGTKVPPKYRNPANPDQTWTGRGKAPHWAQSLQQAGNLDASLIQISP
nr:H-NS histone family protein [Curvibacter delicatus]